MKTVLVTGCSSGYGLETARHFHAQGWNVVATMRTPREGILPRSERLLVLALEQHGSPHGRGDSRRVRAFRAGHLRLIWSTGCGDDRVRCGRGGVARCERCDWAAPISRGRRRGGAGSVEINDGDRTPAGRSSKGAIHDTRVLRSYQRRPGRRLLVRDRPGAAAAGRRSRPPRSTAPMAFTSSATATPSRCSSSPPMA